MRRFALAASAAILGLFLVAVLVVYVSTSPAKLDVGDASAPPGESPSPPLQALPSMPPAPPPATAATPAPEPPPRVTLPPPPPERSGEPPRLMRRIGPVAARLAPLVAPCRPDGAPRSLSRRARPGQPASPADGAATLMLELVGVPGGLEVVGAEVVSYGDASRDQIGCALRAVSGQQVQIPGGARFEPGERIRMAYPLPW